MSQPAQLFQLASLVPVTIVRFRIVENEVQQNVATLWMYGPGPEYYTEIIMSYANTPIESVGIGRSVSLEQFLSCLRS